MDEQDHNACHGFDLGSWYSHRVYTVNTVQLTGDCRFGVL